VRTIKILNGYEEKSKNGNEIPVKDLIRNIKLEGDIKLAVS